jgi:dolichol-phosphate mannosyltransferase
MSTLYVVIPALDEAASIDRLFGDLAVAAQRAVQEHLVLKVVLVDDGSSDGTSGRARAAAGGFDLSVVRHERPLGPGRAFATGFASIAPFLRDHDYVLTLEADNTSPLELLDLMLRRSTEGHDVIFASPYMYGGGIVGTTRSRTTLSHIANSIVKGLLDVRGILTVSSFYRLYRGSAIRRLQLHFGPGVIERAGFECMVELVMKLVFLGMSISEVPMVLDSGRRVGPSKMRVFRTGLGYLGLFRYKRRWRDAAMSAPSIVEELPLPLLHTRWRDSTQSPSEPSAGREIAAVRGGEAGEAT